ncbi:hypothetical protein V8C26DRAFT_140462 [Trichoderma gracile]
MSSGSPLWFPSSNLGCPSWLLWCHAVCSVICPCLDMLLVSFHPTIEAIMFPQGSRPWKVFQTLPPRYYYNNQSSWVYVRPAIRQFCVFNDLCFLFPNCSPLALPITLPYSRRYFHPKPKDSGIWNILLQFSLRFPSPPFFVLRCVSSLPCLAPFFSMLLSIVIWAAVCNPWGRGESISLLLFFFFFLLPSSPSFCWHSKSF